MMADEQQARSEVGSQLRAELDRVRVSLQTASLRDAVVAGRSYDTIWIMPVVDGGPRRSWEGDEQVALALIAS